MENYSYFYVLFCKDGSLYGGYTTDLSRRLSEHNSGDGAKYTRIKSRRPVKLLYAEAYLTKSQAMQAEFAFKKLDRSKKEDFLASQGIKKPYVNFNLPVINDMTREEEADEESKEL